MYQKANKKMTDRVCSVIVQAQKAEEQLKAETEALNKQIMEREEETRRAQALFKLFEEKRFVADVKNGRICQPPIIFQAWNGSIGKIKQYVQGADSALGQMWDSMENTMGARARSHRSALLSALQ